MQSALRLFTNLYPLWTIGGSLAAFYFPSWFVWFSGPWIIGGLMLIMLSMGLTLTVADFRRVIEVPQAVGLGVIAQYTIMPATAWVIASILNLDTPLAVGLILVGCCPGGTASNLVTYLARADVALSVVLTMVSTLLAIGLTPLLTKAWAGQLVPVDALGMFLSTVRWVLLPIMVGVFLNHRFPKTVAKVSDIGPAVAVLVIAAIAGSIVAQNIDVIANQGWRLAIAAIGLHSVGFILGYWVTWLLGFPALQARTVSIEVGMQNSGLATVLAKQHFASGSLVAAPAVFASIFHSIIGSLCVAYWRYRPANPRVAAGLASQPITSTATMPRDRHEIYYWKCDRPAAFHGTDAARRQSAAASAAALLTPVLRRHFDDQTLELRDAGTQGNHLTFLTEHRSVPYFVRVEDGPERDDYMEVEAYVFDAVRRTGVPTPQVILADSTWTEVPLAYQVFERVPHPDLNQWLKQGELDVDAIARQIGVSMATWQGIELAGFGPFDPQALRRDGRLSGLHDRYETYFLLHWRRHLDFLVSRDFLTARETAEFVRVVDRQRELLQLDRGCLVHKDLALWNLLGTANEIFAVIDWDDSIAGDPTDDLSLLACFHGHGFITKVLEGYRSVRPLPDRFARRFWLHLLRNMIVKATIRVGAGYFDKQDDFFLLSSGTDGQSLRQTTLERIRMSHEALRDDQPLSYLRTHYE